MLKFNCYTFNELSNEQLYSALALRSEVFVVGQQIIYQDLDGKDNIALHLLGTHGSDTLAYARIFPPNTLDPAIVFGRVAVADVARGKGYGKLLMQELLNYCAAYFPQVAIKCSAQHYLLRFYNELGFKEQGEVYEEEDIPHIKMIKHWT